MKKNKYILCTICIILVSNIFLMPTISSQNNPEKKEKLIPIIKYNPVDWETVIRESFRASPLSDYVRVENIGKKNKYFINLGQEDMEIFNTEHFSFDGIDNAIQTDSLFLLFFTENPSFYYKGRLPAKYYGVVSNGTISYYENKIGIKRKLSLLDVINIEFGSVVKFKEKINSDFNSNIDFNMSNGIYDNSKEAAIKQLKSDYEYYNECFPNDKAHTMTLFIEFIEKNIVLKTDQKEQIRRLIQAETGNEETSSVSNKSRNNNILLMNKDVTPILSQVLLQDQYDLLAEKDEIRRFLKNSYLKGALYLKLIPISDKDFIIPTPVEKAEYAKEQVFGK